MSDVAVHVEGLGKRYRIGAEQADYQTFRDTLVDALATPFRRAKRLIQGNAYAAGDLEETIWALKDVCFEVERGEVVGIIGRNGAGKSTLLKVLSRITEPTEGFVDVFGRVGSLLEVGTGFHPELSGRENIYLNGAILGMRKAEIRSKFEEIVEFAEIGKFLDTPVKHYSSGMYVRLAFAVAAHLEPEILVVDEVLSVGDAEFQKKCLRKMEDVGQGGRTVLFVSHNMAAVNRLCDRAILLEQGRVVEEGPTQKVVGTYLYAGVESSAVREWPDPSTAPAGDVARLRAVRVVDGEGRSTESVDIRKPVGIEMEFEVTGSGWELMPNFHFFNEEGIHLFQLNDTDPEWRRRKRPPGTYVSTAWIPGNFLQEGRVFVHTALTTLSPARDQFIEHNALSFQVVDSLQPDSARGDWPHLMEGVLRPLVDWSTEFRPAGRTVGVGSPEGVST